MGKNLSEFQLAQMMHVYASGPLPPLVCLTSLALYIRLPLRPHPGRMSTQPLLQRTATKRIALPIRVEPKVSFANERTFLSWLHFTVVLGGLAVGLLNFGDKVCMFSALFVFSIM
jgi:hypothetical protein